MTPTATDEPEVLYCYRCGKRVKREPGRCWYCDAPNRRGSVRPARHCSFCHEVIAQKAIKCPHCREFLDGRPSAEGGTHQHITFNVDKAVFQGDKPPAIQGTATAMDDENQGYGYGGGPQVGGGGAGRGRGALSGGGEGRPGALPGGGLGRLSGRSQRALPAPDDEEQQYDASGALIPLPDHSPTRPPMPLARRDDRAPARPPMPLARRDDRAVGAALPAGSRYPLEAVPAAPAPDAEESRYAICPVCQTEIFSSDNYCFHCGTLQHRESRRDARRRLARLEPRGMSNAAHYALSVALMGGAIFESRRHLDVPLGTFVITPAQAVGGLAVVAFLLLVDALLRRRLWRSWIVTLIFFGVWLLMLRAALAVKGPS
jgi:hypothetical protein